jgi:hypothetical protein
MDIFVEEGDLTPSEPPIHVAFKAPAAPAFRASRLAARPKTFAINPLAPICPAGTTRMRAWVC